MFMQLVGRSLSIQIWIAVVQISRRDRIGNIHAADDIY